MIKTAVVRTPVLILILMFTAVGSTIAQNKVVVVPLGTDAGISGYGRISIKGDGGIKISSLGLLKN